MKINFFRLSLILFTFLLLIGCSKKEGDNNSFIPPQKEQLKQSAYADNESTGDGFTFTANTSWTATVKEVHPESSVSPQIKSEAPTADDSGNSVAWLKIYNGTQEAYSGGPGTVTLRIEVEQNYTGERREATITIRCGNNTFIVTVVQEGTKQDGKENEPPVKVTKITLNETKLSLKVGDKVTLTATVFPANATDKTLTWTSSSDNVTVDLSGKITAVKEGLAIITATAKDGSGVKATCTVNCKEENLDYKSEYTPADYYMWDAYASCDKDDTGTWEPESSHSHEGDNVIATQSCKDCPTAGQMVAYLKAGVYWDDNTEVIEGQKTYTLNGDTAKHHTGLWLKKRRYIENFDSETEKKYSTPSVLLSTLGNEEVIKIRTNGEYFFLPACGVCVSGSIYSGGTEGNYWSSTPSATYTGCAWYLTFSTYSAYVSHGLYRINGFVPMPCL